MKKILLTRLKKEISNIVGNEHQQGSLTVSLLDEAKKNIIRWHQQQAFSEEIKQLKNTHMQKEKQLKKNSGIYNLDPYLDKEGLLRVGGRLKKSNLHFSEIHPLLIGNKSKTTTLIIEWCHQRTAHGGRGLTINEVRSSGFWVVKCNTVVRNLVGKCVKCRLLRGRLGEQKMEDLPNDRTLDGPPFTNCGVDMFGPFWIKEGRKELKRYGALFTCLASRAVHIECTCSMDTDSFIQALRRFIARRGNIRILRCDNGSNFVGAQRELAKAFQEMDHQKIQHFLENLGSDYIIWHRNPPAASHMGGV